MSKAHNKKRNAGLLYEFLVRTISQALVEGNQRKSVTALRLIKRHFRPGTQLHKEYRLINSLVRITVTNDAVAASILQEAKRAAREHDVVQLDREKSLLISNINKALGDADFFDQPVNEYRTYATVQTLLNDWRASSSDLGRLAQYEDQLVSWMVSKKPEPTDPPLESDNAGEGRLLMKVMMRKLNEKYAGALNDDQRRLLRAYAFSTANDDPGSIRLKLAETRDKLLQDIQAFRGEVSDSPHLVDKLDEVSKALVGESLDTVDDDLVTRFMLYTRLRNELSAEEEK